MPRHIAVTAFVEPGAFEAGLVLVAKPARHRSAVAARLPGTVLPL